MTSEKWRFSISFLRFIRTRTRPKRKGKVVVLRSTSKKQREKQEHQKRDTNFLDLPCHEEGEFDRRD